MFVWLANQILSDSLSESLLIAAVATITSSIQHYSFAKQSYKAVYDLCRLEEYLT